MKYKITLNNQTYEVEVEKGKARVLGDPVAAAAPACAPVSDSAPVSAPAGVESGECLSAPMPGAVVAVRVSAGDSVKKGDVLIVLEAMKMENEIVSPRDATVTKVAAQKGTTVAYGDPLVWLA